MNDIIKKANEDFQKLPREIMAHRLSAEAHRHWNMVLGGVATVLTTIVGTAVFTGLVTQFGLDGKGFPTVKAIEGRGGGLLFVLILVLSVLAPVTGALHSFMHNAEDAAAHQISAAGYSSVLCRMTVFLARFSDDASQEKAREILTEYDAIMKEYNAVLAKSLTLTQHAYERADSFLAPPKTGKEQCQTAA